MSKPVIKALGIDPDAPAGSAVREIDQELSTFNSSSADTSKASTGSTTTVLPK